MSAAQGSQWISHEGVARILKGRRTLVLLAAALAFGAVCGHSQTSKIEDCRSIRDNAERLNCYDAFMPPEADGQQEYKAMTVNDVYLDWKALVGRKVSVRGELLDMPGSDQILGPEGGGTVFVDISHAPRSGRAAVAGCVGCIVTLRGTVFGAFNGVAAGINARIGFQKNDAVAAAIVSDSDVIVRTAT